MSVGPIVGLAGAGLIVANAVTGKQHSDLGELFGGQRSAAADTAAHTAMKQLGAELLGVTVMVVAASSSEQAGKVCLAVLGALWVLFLLKHYSGTPAK